MAYPRIACRSALPAVLLLLGGCTLGPSPTPPAPPEPAHYAAEVLSSETSAQGVAQRLRQGGQPVPEWWRAYGNSELNAWVDEGLRNGATLDAARHSLAAAQESLQGQIGGALLPSLDAQAQTQRQRALGIPGLGRPTNLYNVYVGQLALSYQLDVSGAVRYGIEEATSRVDQQAFELNAARRTLAADIVLAAINVASLDAQRQSTERQVDLARSRTAMIIRAQQLGAASPGDRLAVEQDTASLETTLPGLRVRTLQARHALAVLMGRTPDQAPPVLALESLHLPDDVPVSVPSALLRQRPDVLAAEAGVRVAASQVGVATANLFPQISLSASLGRGAFTPSNLFNGAGAIWGLGVSLTQPIFHGGELQAERRASVERYEAALAQYRQAVLNAFQNVADTLVALSEDAPALEAASRAANAARQSFELTDARHRLGALSYPEQVLSEQRWRNAILVEIQARAARLFDTAGLFQAMGELPPAREVRDSR
jgi:NodT family efflux transporter outer membrane factor (OMF) lipoprotein